MQSRSVMLPRLIRFRDAPMYLGMDRKRFNKEVRPSLVVIPIGDQGLAFDRLDLDAWVEDYIGRNGRPAQEGELWDAKERQVSTNVKASGTLTKRSTDDDFAKALARATSKKQKNT